MKPSQYYFGIFFIALAVTTHKYDYGPFDSFVLFQDEPYHALIILVSWWGTIISALTLILQHFRKAR